jgi:DNA-binding transcriptional ArsR family regulator
MAQFAFRERMISMNAAKPGFDRCDCNTIHEDVVRDVQKNMPPDKDVQELAHLFKIFGDPTRVKIVCALSRAEMCVCDIAALLDMTKSAISHQLRVLRQTRLVRFRKDGREVFYSLDDDHVNSIFTQGMLHISHKDAAR